MNRRQLIKAGIIGAAGLKLAACTSVSGGKSEVKSPAGKTINQKIVKPRALAPGAGVGIIAPGTNAQDIETIEKAKEVCDELGLTPVFSDTLRAEFGYKTRSPEIRADELNRMFADDDIDGIFCLRGGYGCQQVLPLLDYKMISRNPKIFAGYSDVTALLPTISERCGFITFHSPVMSSPFTDFTDRHFKEIIFGEAPAPVLLDNPDEKTGLRDLYPTRTISGGEAEGLLVGGNLSLISALCGTPYQLNTEDKILFLEDVGEKPYRIDRMLSQLDMSGQLKNLRGIVFGKCEGCSGGSSTWDRTLGEVLDYYFKPLGIPAFYGLLFGHSANQITLPEYSRVRLDADRHSLTLLEKPTS